MLDRNRRRLNKGDTVRILGDFSLWIIIGFDGVDVDIQNLKGHKLTRMHKNISKIGA